MSLRCWYNFRSPYSWMGVRRILREAPDVTLLPLLQMPSAIANERPNFNPLKLKYMDEDVRRLAASEGLNFVWPDPIDTKWIVPHAAAEFARAEGRMPEFVNALYLQRFSHGRDVANPEPIAAAAQEAGLDAAPTVAASRDREWYGKALSYLPLAEEDGPFGVPFFTEDGRHYWGQDRIDRLLQDRKVRAA